jgi:hypothetical protein
VRTLRKKEITVKDRTQSLSSDPMINLEYHSFFLIADVSLYEESQQVGASHPYNIDHNRTMRVREGIETHASARVAATPHIEVKKRAHKHNATSSQLNKCSNFKHNESNACLWSLRVLECSMEAWCTAPCA